jgi:hypothetical protein
MNEDDKKIIIFNYSILNIKVDLKIAKFVTFSVLKKRR